MVQHTQQQHVIPLQDIELKLEHVSLSLRLTCEMNRRLLQGIRSNEDSAAHNGQTNAHNPLQQRGGDNSYHPVHVHPSQSWQPPIKSRSNEEQEVLTIFHAVAPKDLKAGCGAMGTGPVTVSTLFGGGCASAP